MKESGKERFILTKAYEIAYALFRLATPMREQDFAEKLRTAGADLLQAAAAEDYPAAARTAQIMECLVKFAGDTNLVGSANADITLREIYALDAAIAERRNAAKTDEVNVAEIFSKGDIAGPAIVTESKPAVPAKPIRQNNPATAEPKPAIMHVAEYPTSGSQSGNRAANPANNNIEGMLKSAIRQEAILDKIRQFGNCRMKDILEALPDTSERTLRNDLQTLLEQNRIERIGNSGPSVFYRMAPEAMPAQ